MCLICWASSKIIAFTVHEVSSLLAINGNYVIQMKHTPFISGNHARKNLIHFYRLIQVHVLFTGCISGKPNLLTNFKWQILEGLHWLQGEKTFKMWLVTCTEDNSCIIIQFRIRPGICIRWQFFISNLAKSRSTAPTLMWLKSNLLLAIEYK